LVSYSRVPDWAYDTMYSLNILAADVNANALDETYTFRTETQAAPGDTTPPSLSITAPAAAATLSGDVAVTVDATDNVGVSGVQLKLDGGNLSAEDTSAPYAITWDTTQAANGAHTLTAVARDGAGNTTTSVGVDVTVANSAVTAPGRVSDLSAAARDSSTVTLSFTQAP